MSKLSMGLNIPKKPSLASRPPPAKRKPIFGNDDSDVEDDQPSPNASDKVQSITTLDDNTLQPSSKPTPSKPSHPTSKPKLTGPPPPPPKRPLTKPPQTETNISSAYTSTKHAQEASSLDSTIYDYDSIYDAMKAPPPPPSSSATPGSTAQKPQFMSALKSAAEVRKRDHIRAQDRKTARERDAEGDAFADKESFVTGAYKRQQEDLRRLEAEEAERDQREEVERREGGAGMRGVYKGVLEREEERYRAAVRGVEESKGKVLGKEGNGGGDVDGEEKKKKAEKSEAEVAKEKGVTVNEEGEVVDKRELLKAGLNAGSAVKKTTPVVKPESRGTKGETQRERETREFEEQLLGKHGLSSDEEDAGQDARAGKSRRMEDELLKGLGSP